MITTFEFLQQLYPDPVDPGQLVIWTSSKATGNKHSEWVRTLDEAAEYAHKVKPRRDVYFGVALQDPDRAVEFARRRWPKVRLPSVRGCEASVTALPAIWADIDVAGPGHSSSALPPDEQSALGLLRAIPVAPSYIVHTGGGYHVYWVFHEPWVLETSADREQAGDLLRRLQGALRTEAQAKGWTIDHTADLARVLRIPGTLNLKRKRRRPVRVLQSPQVLSIAKGDRSDPQDFEPLPPVPVVTPGKRGNNLNGERDDKSPARFEPVYEGCPFLQYCFENQHKLPEPWWYVVLSLVGRCVSALLDGLGLAIEFSKRHPGFNPQKTEEKLDHALRSPGPYTCTWIETNLTDKFCLGCVNRGRIKSPIVLGRYRRDRPAVTAACRGPAETQAPGNGNVSGSGRGTSGDSKPVEIVVSTREHEVNDQALEILATRESNLFERAGVLVQIVRPSVGGGTSKAAKRENGNRTAGSAVVRPIQEARLGELLTKHCAFMAPRQVKGGGEELSPVHPPRWTVRALLARGSWPALRGLEGVVECPVLRADGTVLQKAGYDAGSGLLYAPSAKFLSVPRRPTPGQVKEALVRLREVVCDFPFRNDSHFAAWLSSLLTPLARAAFEGPTPLNLIDANVRGSGKSLLADVCSTLLTGRPAARMSYSRDEEELRKSITGLALEATQLVLIDNISGKFGSPTLDRALTADTWRDRLLGGNEQVSVPLRVTWYATGNNVVLTGDTPRRCLHVRLESPLERPEQRTDFRHPRLLVWLKRERPRLLPAALTLLRAYVADGSPDQGLPGWGSYESWSDLVRGTIVWLRLPDPAETRKDLEAGADTEQHRLHDLIHGLAELMESLGGSATAKEILAQLAPANDDAYPLLRSAFEDLFPRLRAGELPRSRQLGNYLRVNRGCFVHGACIDQVSRTNKGMLWTVKKVS